MPRKTNAGHTKSFDNIFYYFREALKKAELKYRTKKIAEFLPFAWEEYEFNRSIGLAVSEEGDKYKITYGDIRKSYYDSIIEGRILNGEPGDLNF